MKALENVDEVRERLAWEVFAHPRFGAGSDRARSLHHLLRRRVNLAFVSLAAGARRCGVPLDFGEARLLVLVVEALDRSCAYCSGVMSVDGIAVVYDVPPTGRDGAPAARGLANVVARCDVCGVLKRSLSGNEWRDVIAALKAADDAAAQAWIADLAVAIKQRTILERGKGTPQGAPAASNARGGRQR
jgi:hypothetical protein